MPLTAFQRRKLDRMFDALDVDGDGVIQRVDFEKRVAAAALLNGWTETSPEFVRNHATAMEQWQSLVETADANEDERISRDEFLRSAEIFLDDRQAVRQYARGDVQLLFDAMDTDGDGKITLEEYRTFLRICGVDTRFAEGFFAHADLDENGRLSRREMSDAMEDFLLGEDPAGRGNFLFGPLDGPDR